MKPLRKVNLESTEELVPDADPLELLDSENEGTELVNEGIALEQAYIKVSNVISAGIALESAGVAPEIIQEALGPVAVEDIALVDSNAGVVVEIALEDDSTSFWEAIKKKANEIWTAIKAYVTRFWEWVKSFFKKAGAQVEVTNRTIDTELAKIQEMVAAASKPAEGEQAAPVLKDIRIEATTTWAMQDKGWKASDLIPRIKHYAEEIVKHAATTAKQMESISGLSKYYLKQIKIKSTNTSPHEIIASWEEDAQKAKANYIGESKFINSTPILIGFTRISNGYHPCKSAEGEVSFKDVNEITELGKMLKLYGEASLEAIRELSKTETVIDGLMTEAESFMRNLNGLRNDVDEATFKKIMPLMRGVMFRHVEMVKEYTTSHGITAQANGVKLIRAVKLQLMTQAE